MVSGHGMADFYQTLIQIQEVLTHQDYIGWTNLIERCMDIGWIEVQAMYYKAIGSRRSGLRWTVAIIKKLWDVLGHEGTKEWIPP